MVSCIIGAGIEALGLCELRLQVLPVFGSHFRDGQERERGRPHLNAARDLQTVKDPYRKLAIRTMKSGRGGAGGSVCLGNLGNIRN